MADSIQSAHRILRRRNLEQRLCLSRSTIYDKINPRSPRYDASFPKPIRLGNGSAVGWIESEVDDYLCRQVQLSRPTAKTAKTAERQS